MNEMQNKSEERGGSAIEQSIDYITEEMKKKDDIITQIRKQIMYAGVVRMGEVATWLKRLKTAQPILSAIICIAYFCMMTGMFHFHISVPTVILGLAFALALTPMTWFVPSIMEHRTTRDIAIAVVYIGTCVIVPAGSCSYDCGLSFGIVIVALLVVNFGIVIYCMRLIDKVDFLADTVDHVDKLVINDEMLIHLIKYNTIQIDVMGIGIIRFVYKEGAQKK
ncbi:MAG: hypothetical protein K6G23_08725 [Lachnospiraceae bacterium]|nr:hypothetical protein [Lachnospiraceae bacterium]